MTLRKLGKDPESPSGGSRRQRPCGAAPIPSTRPETLLMQMQGYVTVAAAEAQGDDPIGEVVRAGWMRIWETVHLSLGADADRTASFFACGLLGNTLAAMTPLPPNVVR